MKNYMKRIIAGLFCVLLVMAFAACDNSGDITPTDENTTAATEGTTPAESSSVVDSESDNDADVNNNADTDNGANTSNSSGNNNSSDNSSGADSGSVNISGAVPESSAVSSSYFDNVAFVGDSVSLKLSYYAVGGALGNAQFFTAGSLGCANALWEVSDESVHPSYQGEKMLIEDCIAKSGVSKVYIMLGMNDIGLYGIDDTVSNYKTLVDRILKKSPNVEIVIQSMTPMTSTSTIIGNNLNNSNIKVYNNRLSEMCKNNGWSFVNVASVMYDANGENLNRDYCSDPDGLGVHFTEAGCKVWIDYLKTHTP